MIRYRKVVSRQLEVLVDKLVVSRSALERLTNTSTEPKSRPSQSASTATAAAQPTSTGAHSATTKQPAVVSSAIPTPAPAATATVSTGETAPGTVTLMRLGDAEVAEPVIDERLIDARKERARKEAAVQRAKNGLRLRDEAAAVFERDLEAGTELSWEIRKY